MRYLLKITYDGSSYHGWQLQPNASTVQGMINQALSEIFAKQADTLGCGRTDTGVHARMFYAQFDHETQLGPLLVGRLNFLLPKDIRIYEIYKVAPDFNARFDALSRTYEYNVHFHPNPFIYKYSLLLHQAPDFMLMNKAALRLLEYDLFTSFSKRGGDNKTDKCKVTEALWMKNENDNWKFRITADRFLRGMVRAIVGTLLLLGYGKITEEDFIHILEMHDRAGAGESVAAHGLFLHEVRYPPGSLLIPPVS